MLFNVYLIIYCIIKLMMQVNILEYSYKFIIINIVIDKISKLIMNLSKKSSYTGTLNGENTVKNIQLVLDKTSKIKLTADSYVTKLTNGDLSNSNIDFNGYKLYVNGEAIN